MEDSLYAILGVDRDADREAIRAAYRDSAKRTHPDVSDDPDATRQFKRLTVARDTLLDTDERARYDELGHDAYLRQHDQADLFDLTQDEDARPAAEPRSATAARSVVDETATDGFGHHDEWWRNREGPEPKQSAETDAAGTERGRDGGPAATWAESRETTTKRTRPSRRQRFASVVRDAGGWLFFHLFLIFSATATGWFLYTSAPPQLAVEGLFAMFLIVGVTVGVAVFHLVSIVYT